MFFRRYRSSRVCSRKGPNRLLTPLGEFSGMRAARHSTFQLDDQDRSISVLIVIQGDRQNLASDADSFSARLRQAPHNSECRVAVNIPCSSRAQKVVQFFRPVCDAGHQHHRRCIKVKKRILGNSNLEVSEIGLGCMSMSGAYGSVVEKTDMISVLRAAVERGVTFFDTAQTYSVCQ
jgi:Aldo/keto reductase family